MDDSKIGGRKEEIQSERRNKLNEESRAKGHMSDRQHKVSEDLKLGAKRESERQHKVRIQEIVNKNLPSTNADIPMMSPELPEKFADLPLSLERNSQC